MNKIDWTNVLEQAIGAVISSGFIAFVVYVYDVITGKAHASSGLWVGLVALAASVLVAFAWQAFRRLLNRLGRWIIKNWRLVLCLLPLPFLIFFSWSLNNQVQRLARTVAEREEEIATTYATQTALAKKIASFESAPPTGTPTLALKPAATAMPTPTSTLALTSTSSPTNTPTDTLTPPPTITPTHTSTPTLSVHILYAFEDRTEEWQTAPPTPPWGDNETAISATLRDEAGSKSGVLWGNFNFGATQADWPRATFFVTLPSGLQDWTSVEVLQFDAQSLPSTGGEVKATIVLQTRTERADYCFNEHGEFQTVGSEWTTLTFPLHVSRYKNCENLNDYNASLLAANRVIELAIVFIPTPDNARFAGEILIDNVRLIQRP